MVDMTPGAGRSNRHVSTGWPTNGKRMPAASSGGAARLLMPMRRRRTACGASVVWGAGA